MTIFAVSSGGGRAGVCVIRLSGPKVRETILSLTKKEKLPNVRQATLGWFYNPNTGEKLDQGLLLYFAQPHSFTGEDVAEFHIHGGHAVVAEFLMVLSKMPSLRIAEPGEFTRRAFDNGKMDLTSAEGLADLINAQTAGQKRQALRQMEGQLAKLYDGWRSEIITSMAYLEVDIDFSDEEIPDDVATKINPIIKKLHLEIDNHLSDGHRGERVRHGLQVVILGAPNAGKSTLLNYLSQRDVAIVSDIAGTTRDLLEVHLDISGLPVTIVDTAGLRSGEDKIEAEGIRRAINRAENADLKLVIIDGSVEEKMTAEISNQIDENTMVLFNKNDVLKKSTSKIEGSDSIGVWYISAKTGEGLHKFIEDFSIEVEKRMELTEAPSLTRTRHRANLVSCLGHLTRYLNANHMELELLSEDLRMAARELGKITGQVDVEDILEKIFKEFCIGK